MLTKYQLLFIFSTIFFFYALMTMLGARTLIRGSEKIRPPTAAPYIDSTPIIGIFNTVLNFLQWVLDIFVYFIDLMSISSEFAVISLIIVAPFTVTLGWVLIEFVASIIGAVIQFI